MRILLFDTSAHGSPWPLFLQALDSMTKIKTRRYAYRFFDEAAFLERKAIGNRVLTRAPDWLTINVKHRRTRMLAYEAATRSLKYQRHPVRYADLNRRLVEEAKAFSPQIVLMVMGFRILPETLRTQKGETGGLLINHATDDPFNGRTSRQNVREAIPVHDVYASTKRAIMDDVKTVRWQCAILQMWLLPPIHLVEITATLEEFDRSAAGVGFVGEGDCDRLSYFTTLMNAIPGLEASRINIGRAETVLSSQQGW